VLGFWRRPIVSLAAASSPATLVGLNPSTSALSRSVLLRHAAVPPRRARLGCAHPKIKTAPENWRGFYSCDVLLIRRTPVCSRPSTRRLPNSPCSLLEYHRGCSVSLPCSEWERVVPLRYCHQSREALALLGSSGAFVPRDVGKGRFTEPPWRLGQSPLPEILKELSALSLSAGSLASTYRFSETNPLRTADATTSEF
jgi:hypothetical protein